MNKLAQTGAATYLVSVFLFVIIWAFWLGGFISEWGARAIASNGLTGIEAFFFANINLVIFFCLMIASASIVAVNSQ